MGSLRTVSHLITTLHTGGTELQFVVLLRELRFSAWRSMVFTLRPHGDLLTPLREIGIEPRMLSLPSTLTSPTTIWTIMTLAHELRRRQATLLHCHDAYSILIGVPAASLVRIPVIAARRDLSHHLGPIQKAAIGMAMRRATVVLANALAVAAKIEREDAIPSERLAYIPNAVDLDQFDLRAALPLKDIPTQNGERSVLMVARMTYEAKGHDDFLHCAALVHEKFPDVRFLLAGDGPRETELKLLASRLGIAEVVRFLGRRNDVPALLRRADVVCHAARAEGLPNAVLEAMAAARPIVATRAGGTPEIIANEEHGLLAPTSSPTELARGLITMLSDQEGARRMGTAARRRIELEHTPSKLAMRTQALYAEVASSQGRFARRAALVRSFGQSTRT